MKNNRKEEHKNAIDDLFNNTSVNSIISEPKDIQPMKEKIQEVKESKETDRKTFNLPKDLVEDMKKIVYMDRDLESNTELVIKALRKYLDSKDCKDLLEEYNIIKGGK